MDVRGQYSNVPLNWTQSLSKLKTAHRGITTGVVGQSSCPSQSQGSFKSTKTKKRGASKRPTNVNTGGPQSLRILHLC